MRTLSVAAGLHAVSRVPCIGQCPGSQRVGDGRERPRRTRRSVDMTTAERTAESTSGGQDVDMDAVIIGAGFSGLYMLHRAAQPDGPPPRASSRPVGRGWAAPGTGTATRVPAATPTATSTASRSTSSSGGSGSGASATRSSTRSGPTWSTWAQRFDLYPGHHVPHPGHVGDLRREHRHLDGRAPTPGEPLTARFVVAAVGRAVRVEHAEVRRDRDLPRRELPHGALAARACRLHRQTGGRDRHRSERGAGGTTDRSGGRRPDGLAAHRELRHPGQQRPRIRSRCARNASRTTPVSGSASRTRRSASN